MLQFNGKYRSGVIMIKKLAVFLFLVLFPFTAFGSFPSVPQGAVTMRVSDGYAEADFSVWAQSGSLYLYAKPATGNISICAPSFTVIQNGFEYNNLSVQGEAGSSFCADLTAPVTLGVVCQVGAAGCPDYTQPHSLTYQGLHKYYFIIFPANWDSSPPVNNLGKNGWWWNPQEPGRGISLEIQGNMLFMAWYTYDGQTGESMWLSSGGTMTDSAHYTGTLWRYRNGQCVGCPYVEPDPPQDLGSVSITFSSDTTASITCLGVTTSIERFKFGSQ